jgi:2-amino-4-hydroxy-6-hydroxymethyldihydropteridine diphosphokinase
VSRPRAVPAEAGQLPPWAEVTERRRGHIARVAELMSSWADEIGIGGAERRDWLDAAWWHDALRDAPDSTLRALVGPLPVAADYPVEMLHGPAAAARLERDGERRATVLEAIFWHTIGHPDWGRTGRALYMADFLEPGRSFARADRAFLAAQVPRDFDGVLRQVVRLRLEWTIREGNALFAETVALWNRVR